MQYLILVAAITVTALILFVRLVANSDRAVREQAERRIIEQRAEADKIAKAYLAKQHPSSTVIRPGKPTTPIEIDDLCAAIEEYANIERAYKSRSRKSR